MRRFLRWLLHAFALVATLALAGVAAPAAGRQSDPVAAGVDVGGVSVGGFRWGESRTVLREAFSRRLVFADGARRWAVQPERLSFVPDYDATTSAALQAPVGGSVAVRATRDRRRLARYVAALDRRLSRPARDARLTGLTSSLKPIVAREVVGRTLDRRATARRIELALRTAVREEVRPVFSVARPPV
jgi:hypothetical protein